MNALAEKIEDSKTTYWPWGPNSNTVARSCAKLLGLPDSYKPPVGAPGWDTPPPWDKKTR